jgi:hypothetical protein
MMLDVRYVPVESESDDVIDPLDSLEEKKELYQVKQRDWSNNNQ